ncbi:MAG: hypothetical protein FJ297_14955 [Planctomycetes bacterium]|nr:hypothetical protein [Planctomycetota bacterium]
MLKELLRGGITGGIAGARVRDCLFAQWTPASCRYVLARRGNPFPTILAADRFEPDPERPVAAQLRERVAATGARCRHAVLVLPRTELEFSTHHLPPATGDELPELVRNAAAAELDESSGTYSSDFLITHQDYSGCDTLVFSMRDERIRDHVGAFESAGFKVAAVTFRGFGASELVERAHGYPASTSMAVLMDDVTIEFAVVDEGKPILFRTIPCAEEDERVRAERVGNEIRRTLALAHAGDDSSVSIYLIGASDDSDALANLLTEQTSLPTATIHPFSYCAEDSESQVPSECAALVGVACAWNRTAIPIDLLHPRRPPVKPGPWRRAVLWGGVAAAVLIALGAMAWKDAADESAAIAERRNEFKQLGARSRRALELRDLVESVDAWRRDEIAWLDRIRELSEQLPDGEQLVIRRMSMSTGSDGNGVIDLAVQVSAPGVVADLEDAIRGRGHSVSSKRVSESDEKAKLPWVFETRVALKADSPAELPIPEMAGEEPKSESREPARGDAEVAKHDNQRGGDRP